MTDQGRVVDISIVLLNWNGAPLVEQCLDSIKRSGTRCSYEIVIADNASTDGSQEWLRSLENAIPLVRFVYNRENRGFGAGNNQALPYCTGRYILSSIPTRRCSNLSTASWQPPIC